MNWIPFPDDRLQVNGLWWWEETRPRLWRLPERMNDLVPPGVWSLAQQPSGARIRFATDSDTLAIRLHYPSLGYMNNMTRIGQLGVDLYVDGVYWKPVYPTDSANLEATFFSDLPRQRREITLYLGLYAPVEVLAIGLSDGALTYPPLPFSPSPRVERGPGGEVPFSPLPAGEGPGVRPPLAFYGTSLTQGGCASRPSMSYQAILGRALNLDFINLGFSGSGKGEPALAAAVAEIDASCFVMDFAQNNATPEALESAYAPFLQTIRDCHPLTPIVCITPIYCTSEDFGAAPRVNGLRQVIRDAVASRRAQGDEHLTLVEGYDLLGPEDREGLVDEVHPNDIGFVRMAEGLEPVLRRVLSPD